MPFARTLPPAALAQWCRACARGFGIGLPPAKVFRQQSTAGPPAARGIAADVAARLEKGGSVADALAAHRDRFPPLFVELVAVGEESGRLTEAFDALEDYFTEAATARKIFAAALVWPAFMFASAVLVIAFMLLILGLLAPAGGKAFDPLGLGLTGPRGALVWLLFAGGFGAILAALLYYLRESASFRAKVEAKGLRLPGLSKCVRSFALHRFSTGLAMTAEAGIRPDRSLALSLRATGNAAYAAQIPAVTKRLKKGDEIGETLSACPPPLFPAEFLDAVEVGETSGQLAEVMARQARTYRDEAARRMKQLAAVAGGAVYAMVGLMVLALIVRLLMAIGGVYQDAMQGL